MGNNARDLYQTVTNEDEHGFEYTKGNWYLPVDNGVLGAAGAITIANFMFLHPLLIRAGVLIKALGTFVSTGAPGAIQAGIYRANLQTLMPEGTPVGVTGDIDVSVAQNVNGDILGGPIYCPKGLYWAGANYNAGAINMVGQYGGSGNCMYGNLIGGSTPDVIQASSTNGHVRLHAAATYGTWPDLSNVTQVEGAGGNSMTIIHFQVAP